MLGDASTPGCPPGPVHRGTLLGELRRSLKGSLSVSTLDLYEQRLDSLRPPRSRTFDPRSGVTGRLDALLYLRRLIDRMRLAGNSLGAARFGGRSQRRRSGSGFTASSLLTDPVRSTATSPSAARTNGADLSEPEELDALLDKLGGPAPCSSRRPAPSRDCGSPRRSASAGVTWTSPPFRDRRPPSSSAATVVRWGKVKTDSFGRRRPDARSLSPWELRAHLRTAGQARVRSHLHPEALVFVTRGRRAFTPDAATPCVPSRLQAGEARPRQPRPP